MAINACCRHYSCRRRHPKIKPCKNRALSSQLITIANIFKGKLTSSPSMHRWAVSDAESLGQAGKPLIHRPQGCARRNQR